MITVTAYRPAKVIGIRASSNLVNNAGGIENGRSQERSTGAGGSEKGREAGGKLKSDGGGSASSIVGPASNRSMASTTLSCVRSYTA